MTRLRILVCALVSCLFDPRAAVANLLVNGGFETGDFTGWTVGGNAVSAVAADGTPIASDAPGNYVHPRTGNYAAFATLRDNAPLSTITLAQSIPVQGGVQYGYTVRYGSWADPTPYASFTAKQYVNGVGTGGTSTITALGNHYGSQGSSFFAPAGATSVLFTFEFTGKLVSTGGPIGYSLDDFDISPIPEPATPVLLALAFPLMLRRRCPLSRKATAV